MLNWHTGLILLLMFSVIAAVILPWLYQKHRQDKIAASPFPTQWRKILQQQLPIYRKLPSHLQLRLKKLVQLFIEEKQFIGCEGLEINDQIRLNIAAQACLLLLNRQGPIYPHLRTILVYPAAFAVHQQQQNQHGIVDSELQIRLGESWSAGRVVLSWQDSFKGGANPSDGVNVVLHEFAHQLDQENGFANGAPRLESTEAYQHWSKTLSAEFEQLQLRCKQGQPSLFSAYAATDPAEFFAVITEVFFEQARLFKQQHPELYQQLVKFYRLDPSDWW